MVPGSTTSRKRARPGLPAHRRPHQGLGSQARRDQPRRMGSDAHRLRTVSRELVPRPALLNANETGPHALRPTAEKRPLPDQKDVAGWVAELGIGTDAGAAGGVGTSGHTLMQGQQMARQPLQPRQVLPKGAGPDRRAAEDQRHQQPDPGAGAGAEDEAGQARKMKPP